MRNSIKDLLESMEIQKHTTETFHEIEKLQNPNDCSFAFISSSETEKGELRKHGNKYVVTLAANRNYNSFSESIFPAKIEVGNDAYYSDDALVTKTIISSNVFPAIEYEVSLSNLHKGNDSKFYRIVLPLDRELDLIGLFTVYKFCFNHYGSSIELVKTYIEGREFHIYKLSNNKSNYLLIDCLSEIAYEGFYNQVLCILCALGILTGCFVEDECFILSSDTLDFSSVCSIRFRSLRKSIYAPYQILPTNPYNFFSSDIAQSKRNLMAHIHTDVFTRLVNKTYFSITLENSLFIFLEALSYPLDTQPACLSVVLEGLCNYIKEDNDKSFKPITDKRKARELKKCMKQLLDGYESDFSPDGRQIIEKRIDDINNPTNRGKFEKAISLLGLELTDYEKEALLNRNTFLHCTTELKSDYIEIKQDSPEYVKLFLACQILVRLLYKMILKIIGYEGNIVNILKHNDNLFESIKDEPMLIEI